VLKRQVNSEKHMKNSIKHSTIVILLLITVIQYPANAVRRHGLCWLLSEETTNEEIGQYLKESEDYARKNDFKRAAASLKHLINWASTNDEIRTELDYEITDGPLLLHIIAARANYLNYASKHKDITVAEECIQAISNYAERAAGKCWGAYKQLYMAASICYAPEYPQTNRIQHMKDLFLYDQLDPEASFNTMHHFKCTTNELRWILDTYYAHGGEKDLEALNRELKYATYCDIDVIPAAIEYLEIRNKEQGPGNLRHFFYQLGSIITNQSIESLQQYRNALSNVMIRQAPEKAYNLDLGYIIDERNKIDNILAIKRSSQ
jgi:hypothetical protein